MVGSVPRQGIIKSAGTTAASANGLRPRALEVEEQNLVGGGSDGDNGGGGWPKPIKGGGVLRRLDSALILGYDAEEGTDAALPRKLYVETAGSEGR